MTRANADRPVIGITAGGVTAGEMDDSLRRCVDAVERAGAAPWVLAPGMRITPAEALDRVGALVLTAGPDLNPVRYGHHLSDEDERTKFDDARDAMELDLIRAALDADLPLYGIGRGMHVLNAAMGGRPAQNLDGHARPQSEGGEREPAYHHIYISPGSKLAAVVGSGGFVRVNSLHQQGVREAQKAPRLLASAYSLEDGLIEALESPEHRWVIAVQFRPERRMEVPPHFDRLFQSLVERAAERVRT